jgi:thiamine biosynthesis lipoprotein
MRSSDRSAERRRARPLLGTLVELRVSAAEGDPGPAIAAAFAAVARVHALMSVHDRASELSRLNRCGHIGPIAVDPWIYRVLTAALAVAKATGGSFDCTVAPVLARHRLLPRDIGRGAASDASWRDLRLHDNGQVSFARPLAIDLGGIAKGFAVDRAVDALRAGGVRAGLVNAGGDMRLFGPGREPIHVRDPIEPSRLVQIGSLADGAVATSSFTFVREAGCASPIIDPFRRRPLPKQDRSVSVIAPEAMIADALTKPMLLGAGDPAALLDAFGAHAVILEGTVAPRGFPHAA